MKRLALMLALLCLAATVLAADAPQVTAPANGDRLGPNADVVGKTDGKQFVVIITDVYVQSKYLKSVPGHRHFTDEMGNFSLRISTPRVTGAEKKDIKYKIRAFTLQEDQTRSPETVVTCYPK